MVRIIPAFFVLNYNSITKCFKDINLLNLPYTNISPNKKPSFAPFLFYCFIQYLQ